MKAQSIKEPISEESSIDKFNDKIDEILEDAQKTLSRTELMYLMAQIEATSADFLDGIAGRSPREKQAIEYVRDEMQKALIEERDNEST